MKDLKISFSLRAFIIYFVILGSLSWYLVNNALERLNDGMRQSAESVMVDMSHLLAAQIEEQLLQQSKGTLHQTEINIDAVEGIFSQLSKRTIDAKIYEITKTVIDSSIYITDKKGKVIYDSRGLYLGQNFSQWRDVRLTLEGEYGARTSFIDQDKTEDDDEKIMVVAAPIKHSNEIIGAVSVVKSINSLEGHLKTESSQLKNYALILVLFAIIIGYLFSIWLTKSLETIANYTQALAQGKNTTQPQFWDHRLENLASSVTTLRNKLDGKEYVEDYIHSLTHELKTPITSIRGASELLQENIPAEERQRFINNISSSNHRMAQLVDKMLSLAKLESQTELVELVDFDLSITLGRLLEERQTLIANKALQIKISPNKPYSVNGDRILIRQALANLLDNAITFCPKGGQIKVTLGQGEKFHERFNIRVFNHGEQIPDYALERIYERFFSLPRKNNDPSLTSKSTGLGLSFVSEIMKLHKGKITIKNYRQDNDLPGVMATLEWSTPSEKEN